MAATRNTAAPSAMRDERPVMHRKWVWYLLVGTALAVLGAVALGTAAAGAVRAFGWALLVGGAAQAAHGFARRAWSGFYLDLLIGTLYVGTGFIVLANPGASTLAVTLLVALFLILAGLFRLLVTAAVRHPHWSWLLLNGAVSLLLGIALWQQWPLSGASVPGLYVGIEMILDGATLAMLGLAARNWPRERRAPRATEEESGLPPADRVPAH